MHGGLAVADRLAEIAAQGPLEEAEVLHEHGIVKAHGLAEAGHVLGRRVGRQEEGGRVTGEVQYQEHDDRDAEEHEHRLPEPAEEIGPHARARSNLATASMCGVCGNMSTGCTHSRR